MNEIKKHIISEYLYEGKDGSLSVQSYINNFSFPNSLEELLNDYIPAGYYDIDSLLNEEEVIWTVPKWTKPGDIVFFMHAKTAIAKIAALISELNSSNSHNKYSSSERILLRGWLERGRQLHKEYGGKILALGRVAGKPFYKNYQTGDFSSHYQSRIYADIDSVIPLENPIDISEFNSFIYVTRAGAITPVFGKDFEKLREIIGNKNRLPRYVRESVSIPIPIKDINRYNWIVLGGQYRRSFFLEIQFRSFYTNYLLPLIGDQKKIYRECRCSKSGMPDSFVDNIIKLNKKYLPVEIKLDINAEANIKGQVAKYCHVDTCFLSNKDAYYIESSKMFSDKVMIIDTYNIYLYDNLTNQINTLYNLDNLKNEDDILLIKQILISSLKG